MIREKKLTEKSSDQDFLYVMVEKEMLGALKEIMTFTNVDKVVINYQADKHIRPEIKVYCYRLNSKIDEPSKQYTWFVFFLSRAHDFKEFDTRSNQSKMDQDATQNLLNKHFERIKNIYVKIPF
jgi:hypothetical protein